MKICVLLDSGSGITEAERENKNIELLPLYLSLEDGTEFKDIPENLEKNNFFVRISNGENVKTSICSPGELIEKYNSILKKYDHILHITITKNLSGMNDLSNKTAESEEFKGKVTIVKHDLAANALKYLAFYFNKMIEDGVEDIKEFQKAADKLNKTAFMGLIPGDLSKLSRGGRAKSMLMSFLRMMKTKLLIQWGVKPKKIAMGRTIVGLIEKMNKIHAKSKLHPDHYLTIFVHTPLTTSRSIQSGENILKNLNYTYVTELIPNVYTAHAGVETVGVVLIPNEFIVN